jgi:sugar lactone lactonase YvrE
VTLDSSGNVYVTDYGDGNKGISGAVYIETRSGTNYTQTQIGTFVASDGIAVGSSGNVYVADFGCPVGCTTPSNGGLYKLTYESGTTYSKSQITSLQNVNGVAVDSGGNLYVAVYTGFAKGAVYKETPSGGGNYSQTTVASNFVTPESVAVDPSGNLYITDDNGQTGSGGVVYKETLSGGTYTVEAQHRSIFS